MQPPGPGSVSDMGEGCDGTFSLAVIAGPGSGSHSASFGAAHPKFIRKSETFAFKLYLLHCGKR